MTVKELTEKLNLKVITGQASYENSIKNCYICDLLSQVMAKGREGDAWITIQTNINIIAVATLIDAACIIIAEGALLDEAALIKAKQLDLAVLSSSKTAFELACEIGRLL